MPLFGSRGAASVTGFGGLAKLGYLLRNSLRFRASNSAYLSRTPASATNQKTFTISFWSKLGQLGTYRSFFSAGTANPPFVDIGLQNTDEFQVDMSVSAGRVSPKTTAVFRDPSAWYHFVVAFDTTQATQANRVKVYVNGVQQTISALGVAQNTDLAVNSVVAHDIGRRAVASDSYLDGYMTEVNFIDGQALTPSSFAKTDPATGQWIPIKFGGAYGTNGFYLKFTDTTNTTTLSYDYSPNGNNWTPNNISLTAGSTYDSMTDVPTLTSATAANYCTLNPLFNPNGSIVTYSNGNLNFSHSSGTANQMPVQGTIALPAGKFYWEYTVGATVNDQVGIATAVVYGGSADGTAGARYLNGGTFQSSYTTPSSAASYTTGDVIGVAYDQPNGTLAFYKNNSLQGTVTTISTSEVFFPSRSPNSSGSGGAGSFNFGQRPFAYTAPSGFLPLNTFNL